MYVSLDLRLENQIDLFNSDRFIGCISAVNLPVETTQLVFFAELFGKKKSSKAIIGAIIAVTIYFFQDFSMKDVVVAV